ncbi:MAG: pyridoxamine 5'-phosphate oxidase family protein [Nocardiopsaceae bacterium]|nr:pyridoxamine 5'-phosphate oxidase family protein [Nocardiopsaceae bacterium]
MSLALDDQERREFLADVHVGVISIARDGDRAPLTVPIWYDYAAAADDVVTVITPRESLKARLITAANRFSLCAQTEEPPYRYVSVEGPVSSIEPLTDRGQLAALAGRYLPPEFVDLYMDNGAGTDSVVIRMRPQRWLSTDFRKLLG